MAAGDLAIQLAAARSQLGWSLRTAERASGVPNAHISQIETGAIAEPGYAVVAKLAAAYGMDELARCPTCGRPPQSRELADARAENARLRTELDRYQGRQVMHTTEAHMDEAAMASLDEPDGTILRATDTSKELLMYQGTWAER